MNTEFTKQWAICNRQDKICFYWFNAWWFVGGLSIMSLLVGSIVLSIMLYVAWGITTFVMGWHVERYGREVDKLGEKVAK